jgi:cysteine-rich repeat protein
LRVVFAEAAISPVGAALIRAKRRGVTMTKRSATVLVGCTLSCLVFAGSAAAQVSPADQACITAFNKSIRKVLNEKAKVVRKCLRDFAAGKLVATTAEECIRSDPSGKVERAAQKAQAIASQKCAGPLPEFGVTPMETALVEAVLSPIKLIHGSVGANLNTFLIATKGDASCQAQVAGALFQCKDARVREFLKCQKKGLRAGTIANAETLASVCLGTGAETQPDTRGTIASKCGTKVAAAITRHCSGSDLTQVFTPCGAPDGSGLATCLDNESACQLCLLLNEIDGLERDCDLFDDGDGINGSCGAECGDGVVQGDESCDDGNGSDLDGCSSECQVEGGWTCTGEPSVCTLNCGNGILDAGETCDDGNAGGGDGCSSECVVEAGYSCTGQPSVCTPNCGNGIIQSGEGEACDDGNGNSGDGCTSTCQVEPGYNCSGQPSVCVFVCGNGTFQPGETCDDGNTSSGDGCSGVCQIEPGWLCSGQPSLCAPLCGDGLIRGNEGCDDGNATSGDGCSFSCQPEAGYQCTGQPSNCLPICGDGLIRGLENCDDGNTMSGDGCSGNFCRREVGYTCLGQPSVCTPNCGNGVLNPLEQCDDGNAMSGDGCSNTCQAEPGYACGGQPSVCVLTCGNGVIDASENCDDGNIVSGDGCSASCRNESGWLCTTAGQACSKFDVFIDTPAHGIFTTAGSVNITGHYTTLPPGQVAVTINGVPASSVNETLRTFSHTLSLSQALIFNPVRATLTNTANNDRVHDRIVVIAGESVADGAFSLQSVAMRINDTGLDAMEPLVSDLAAGQLNLGQLLPPGMVIIDDCFITVIGCWGSAQVRIANPPPSYSHLTLAMDSRPNVVFGDIRIFNLRIDLFIDGSGLVPDCGLRLTASSLRLTGDYALQPMPGSPSDVDVNLVTPMGVQFSGFNHTFTSGICDDPIIGDIIQALLPDIEAETTNAIRNFLSDPDGPGPQDSPIADGIEEVLAGISISGPIGEGLGLMFESPLFDVIEDHAGITFGSHSRFTVSVGTGPGQCVPPPGAPDLTRSYSKSEVFPSFGANTPVGNVPYGLGICISSAGFNQLLRGQTECGLMRASLDTIDLDGPGGAPPLPVTSTLLSLLVPEFGQLPANTPLRIDIAPTLAPIVTGNNGPNGELTELKIAHVTLDIVEPGPEKLWLRGALDTRLGMNLAFLPDGSGLSISLSQPALADLTIAITENPLGTNEAQVETVLPALIRPLIPELAGALSGFPLPQFFGLSLQGVEVSRNGAFMSLFANLTPVP